MLTLATLFDQIFTAGPPQGLGASQLILGRVRSGQVRSWKLRRDVYIKLCTCRLFKFFHLVVRHFDLSWAKE
jgi:hypothetical protein